MTLFLPSANPCVCVFCDYTSLIEPFSAVGEDWAESNLKLVLIEALDLLWNEKGKRLRKIFPVWYRCEII